MIRSLAATLFALVMMGGLAVSAQADSTATSGTVTGNSTLTATADPFVFDSNFAGSGVDTVSGNFTTTNMGTTKFNSTFTSFTSSVEPGCSWGMAISGAVTPNVSSF
jgi:hypothetical protein